MANQQLVSEPRAVATGSWSHPWIVWFRRYRSEFSSYDCESSKRVVYDPVATARGSDTALRLLLI